jgi:endonuclease/exonuclease/phosphatase (EEP) superfamily protein YafD
MKFSNHARLHTSVAALLGLVVVGCVSLPDSDQLIANSGDQVVRMEDAACADGWLRFPGGEAPGTVLVPADFSLMTWNVFKGQSPGWPQDYVRLTRDQDIVLLQEAHLTPTFSGLLEGAGYRWYMTRAFDYNGAESGVLTAGRMPASGACLARLAEPLIRVPKSGLLTRFPINGSGRELWVANLHGINFAPGAGPLRGQLDALAEVLADHPGPMILAGDFNDWSESRSAALTRVTERLGLIAVRLAQDDRSRYFGRPVDHVFYRGLEVVYADSVAVTSSDHNPVRVRFRLPESRLEPRR